MDMKKANIVLRVFMAIWILLSIALLILLLCNGALSRDNMKYVFQLLVSIVCSIWLGIYIWKHGK